MPAGASYLDEPFAAHHLLPVTQTWDFNRNFRKLEVAYKKPYSLAKVIRELAQQPPKLTGFEMECDQELKSLNRDRHVMGRFIPTQALLRRNLTAGVSPAVQTSVEDEVIPFLRYKSVTGRLGATLLTDLVGGPW